MIRRNFLLVIICLLISNSVYGATEVKPPEGPFISQLRVTFSVVTDDMALIKKNAVVKEKTYNFQVPDLGRYQERSPATVLSEKPSANPSVFKQTHSDVRMDRSFQPVFDNTAFSYPVQQNNYPQNSPYSMPYRNQRQQASKSMSFDAMPISANTDGHLIGSYPSEWSQLNPINRVQDKGAVNNQFGMQNQPHQNNYSTAQPFSNPRLNEPQNNNPKYGYK